MVIYVQLVGHQMEVKTTEFYLWRGGDFVQGCG